MGSEAEKYTPLPDESVKIKDQELFCFDRKYRPARISLAILLAAILICVLFTVIVLTTDQCSTDKVSKISAGKENQNDIYYEGLDPDNSRPYDVRDLVRADRISGAVPSPDGTKIAFLRRVWSTSANVSSTSVWLYSIESKTSERLVPFEWGQSDHSICWDSESSTIYFISDRSGSGQIWQVSTTGSSFQRLTNFPVSVQEMLIDPTSKWVAFSAKVIPTFSMEDTAILMEQYQTGHVPKYGNLNGVLYTKLFVRHWDHWETGLRNHVFLAKFRRGGFETPQDLMSDWDVDVPTDPFGDRGEWSFSTDGSAFAFSRYSSCDSGDSDIEVCVRDEQSPVAWLSNVNICVSLLEDDKWEDPFCTQTDAITTEPRFHPTDPQTLMYIQTYDPGYESAQRFLLTTTITEIQNNPTAPSSNPISPSWTFSVAESQWSPDGSAVYLTAQYFGTNSLFSIDMKDKEDNPTLFSNVNSISGISVISKDQLCGLVDAFNTPANIYSFSSDETNEMLTTFNSEMLSHTLQADVSSFNFIGANNTEVYGWVLPPTQYDDQTRYPVAMLIHGGPQGAWNQGWSYRWNPQLFASSGFFVLCINFHGSTGYGQAFTDSITGNWGGLPYDDLIIGLDSFLADPKYQDHVDSNKVVALGASYGGYMVNWINGHTDRFNALVCHDGIFDLRAMYYDTEELWFPEHDMLGPEFDQEGVNLYELWNPQRFVTNWTTPTLIIHGGKDYRLPDTHGISAFTALQRMGIPSEFLYFPDENHWILNPVNLCFWYDNVLGFIEAYTS